LIGDLHEATVLEDAPENNKEMFKSEQALWQKAQKDINFDECEKNFACRAAKFYRVMFSNASKMIAVNEQQFLSYYESQMKAMHQQCATRCSPLELQELKNDVDKNVLKYNNLYKIFKKKCFPACVLLDMSTEYLKKIGLTSKKGFGKRVFDLIKVYECSGRNTLTT